jgi:hypothetical protein
LGDELEVNLGQPADDYLAEGKERLKQHYGEQLESNFSLLLTHLTEQVEEYYQGALASISNELPIDELKKIEKNLATATGKGQN